MILPVFLSLTQENEKTALVKVNRGQRGPWRGLLSAALTGENGGDRQGPPHTHTHQAYLVLALLLDSSSPIPGIRVTGVPGWGALHQVNAFNSTFITTAEHANVLHTPHDGRTKQGQGPPEAHSLIREEWRSHRKTDYRAESNQSTQKRPASNTEIYRSEKSNSLKGIKQCTWSRAHLKLKDGYEALE